MENSLPIWLIPTIALFVGVVIGLILARIFQSSSPHSSHKQLKELQERFDSYQTEVVNHFGVTAELVHALQENQQKVQQHMLHSAERLALDEQSRERLLACLTEPSFKERLSSPTETAVENLDTSVVEPPKDYAPKPEGELGTLDESFGHKK